MKPTMAAKEYRAVANKIANRKKQPTPETMLRREVEKLLALMPQVMFYWRINVGVARHGYGEGERWVRYGYPGMADFYVRVRRAGGPARTIWLELKSDEGRQSLSQRGFQVTVEALGDSYRVVRSVSEAEVAIRMGEG